MKIKAFTIIGLALSYPAGIFAQDELKPVFDKSLLDIQVIEKPVFEFQQIPFYIDKLKLKTDFDYFAPYVEQGMKVVDFTKIPVNTILNSQQIFQIKHPSGKTYTVINRMPGGPFAGLQTPSSGSGTAVSFDFNNLIYYALHPGEKARKKRTALKREQICNYVYASE